MPPVTAMIMAQGDGAQDAWRKLRADGDIQFAPVEIPPTLPREPSWLDRVFAWLAEMIAPLGEYFGGAWPVLRWVLLAAGIALALFIAWRMIEPMLAKRRNQGSEEVEQWHPQQQAALALLEDADRLAAQGHYDEATHLLLLRSVSHIVEARPDWVEPSSTARELTRLPWLPEPARHAFSAIAERVERSRFALRALERADWDAARTAYADFALARLRELPA